METSERRPRVVVADDHTGIRERVSEVLADVCTIAATVSDGGSAIRAAVEFEPDVLIMDFAMPGLDGIHAAREIRRLGVAAKLVFLSLQQDPDYLRAVRSFGASYVLKSRIHTDLSLAIKDALAGRAFVSPFPVGGVS